MAKDAFFFCLASAEPFRPSLSTISVFWLFLFLVVIGAPVVRAQQRATRHEFWPEIDVYIHVKPKLRLYLLGTVSESVEDGELRNAKGFESQIGAHVDYI
ncbi:MAG TPA: hypothetical protein VM783_03460, partial [Candidatus Acidoferrum sp.]|nr:hypothetical protein [Candidatus Acidoferrum sp.]